MRPLPTAECDCTEPPWPFTVTAWPFWRPPFCVEAKEAAIPCARPLLKQPEVELFIKELRRLLPPELAADPMLELLLEVGLEIGGCRTPLPLPTLLVPLVFRDL